MRPAGKRASAALRFVQIGSPLSCGRGGAPRMKQLHLPVTSAFPAALATASIFLAVVMLPGGAAPSRSSDVAPALKLVAGAVVAAVESPVHVVTRPHRPARVAVSHATARPQTRVRSGAGSAPSPRPVHHRRTLSTHRVQPAPVAAAPKPVQPVTKQHGEGTALGLLRKSVQVGHGRGHAYGHSPDAPHCPLAVPPGHSGGQGR